jgi:hypothetical protein
MHTLAGFGAACFGAATGTQDTGAVAALGTAGIALGADVGGLLTGSLLIDFGFLVLFIIMLKEITLARTCSIRSI